MRKKFPGFYHPKDDEINSEWQKESTLFVFDTNTLLNLYGYAQKTRNDFFSILENISGRIWLPYHVALEYQRRRLTVIKEEKAIFNKAEKHLESIEKIFEFDFPKLNFEQRVPGLHKATEKLCFGVKKLITNYKKSLYHWDAKQPCVRSHDMVRERLNTLFEDKIGPIPTDQKWLENVYVEGKKRFKFEQPPGFEDKKKDNDSNNEFIYAGLEYKRLFGDLIIWKQILEKAKESEIKTVIFITDDAKKDWWYILDSRGKKNIGPRAELREEICSESGVDFFTMYNTSNFLKNGKQILSLEISQESINEASDKFIINTIFSNKKKNKELRNKAYNEIVESSLYNTSLTKALAPNYVMDSLVSPEAERIRNILFSPEAEKDIDLFSSPEAKRVRDLLSTSLQSNLEPDYLTEFSKFQSKSINKEAFKKLVEFMVKLKDDKDD